MHEDEVTTDAALVERLIAAQFPEWASLPVARVDSFGTDNAIYRLGDEWSVRLPRVPWAVAPLEREFAWLPRIAERLPVEVPVPVALGAPGPGFAWPWTVCRWLEGDHPEAADRASAEASAQVTLARDLARFVRAMRALDPAGAPITAWPRPLPDEADLVLAELDLLGSERVAALAIWEEAVATRYDGPPTWIHGDLAPGNLLLRDGRLSGVLDFGTMGVGDPASDLRVAWNLLSRQARATFRDEVGADEATWTRARGWALLQAVAQLSYFGERHPRLTANARRVVGELTAEREGWGERPAAASPGDERPAAASRGD